MKDKTGALATLLIESIQSAIQKGYTHYRRSNQEFLPTVQAVIEALTTKGEVYMKCPEDLPPIHFKWQKHRVLDNHVYHNPYTGKRAASILGGTTYTAQIDNGPSTEFVTLDAAKEWCEKTIKQIYEGEENESTNR